MGLISGIGRWQQRHVSKDEGPGLTAKELTTVLRTTLPVLQLPEFIGKSIDFDISESANGDGYRTTKVLHGRIDWDGTMRFDLKPKKNPDGSAAATINTWFGVLLDGNRGRVRVRGNLSLVDACLTQLYEVLWEEENTNSSARLSSTAAGDG
jgi:hypothetical protein